LHRRSRASLPISSHAGELTACREVRRLLVLMPFWRFGRFQLELRSD
jgi:hypothetical protein